MKNKGFTLVELLAVIVILAVISLIATPMVLKVIENAKKGSYIESARGILDAAEKYTVMNFQGKETIDLTNDTKLSYKGKKPSSGTLLIDEKGHFSIIARYEDYCIEKKFSDNNPNIVEKENCTLADSEIIKYDNYIGLNKSNNNCVTDSSTTCSKEDIIAGLEVSVNVNDNENYTFNVLKDNGDSLDLQINFNIGEKVAWASLEDYEELTGNKCAYTQGCNDMGPITVLRYLKNLTDKWTNIENQTGTISYTNNIIDMSNYKARLMTINEARDLGCLGYKTDGSNNNSCPSWFGPDEFNYHLISAYSNETNPTDSWLGKYYASYCIDHGAWNASTVGAKNWLSYRPVITLKKSSIK